MPRERSRDDTRNAIAVHAARLMTQDGIEDYGLAKRKAAKQLGIPESGKLPTNDEIDVALREYQGIYQGDVQAQRVRELRLHAVKVMRKLTEFDPHLTGSALSGIAGPYAGIRLQLFTDNIKAVELLLINRDIAYKTTQTRLYAGQEVRLLPVFTITDDGIEVELTVFELRDLRMPARATPEGRTIERARLAAVENLLS